jgi:hypothetical protein
MSAGDAAFDRAFLIEAAPARVARMLLDTPERRLLASYDAAVLTTEQPDGRPVLRLSVPPGSTTRRSRSMSSLLSARRHEMPTPPSRLRRFVDPGSPYRPQLDDAQVDS